MEPNRSFGRGSYNRNTNMSCNQSRQMNSCDKQMSMSSSQMSLRQRSNRDNDCDLMRIFPISDNNNCDCKDNNSHMRHFSVGIGYVPMQEWGELYDMEKAYYEGTIFPELNLIFCGVRGKM